MTSIPRRHAPSPRPLALRIAAGLLLGAAALAGAGCNIAGPALFLVADDRIPAVYQLDPKRPTVVFIDDRASVLPSRAARARIAKAAEKALLEAKVLQTDLIGSEGVQQVVSGERFGRPRSVAEIGRAVGAEQVVYATVDRFTLTSDGSQYNPQATLRVKVIDAKSGERLFPPDMGGGKDPFFTLSTPDKVRAEGLPKSPGDIAKAENFLADETGRHLAELFFKHTWRDPNSKVGQ